MSRETQERRPWGGCTGHAAEVGGVEQLEEVGDRRRRVVVAQEVEEGQRETGRNQESPEIRYSYKLTGTRADGREMQICMKVGNRRVLVAK